MRLEKASRRAVVYACKNFHYAKRVPVNYVAYSVFNDEGAWCGVIVFGAGIMGIEKPYKLGKGTVYELVRVALNGKQGVTTKIVSTAVKIFKKASPCCKLLVSYADSDQNHNGVIYQAMNWTFTGSNVTCCKWTDKTGKEVHNRRVDKRGFRVEFGKRVKCAKPEDLIRHETGVKHKYIYPLDKSLIPMCKALSKPYPKKCDSSITANVSDFQSGEEGQHHPIAQKV